MKLNNQKRWKKTSLVTIGFAMYSVLTAVSYSANDWNFPNGTVFKEPGKIVWEGEAVSKTEKPYYSGWAEDVIHGKVVSTISGSYWGTVDGYHGVVLAPGVIVTFSGTSKAASSYYDINVNYQYKAEPNATSTRNTAIDAYKNSRIYMYSATMVSRGNPIKITGNNEYRATNLKAALYISKSVKPGTYSYPGVINLEVGEMRVYINNGIKFTYTPPIECTINTPPKIDFGNVNIWDWEGNTIGIPGGNRKDVLKVVDGNFTINCTGDNGAKSPAKLTLKGTIYEVTNDLKMTMDATNKLAPATVRASIKSIIAPCASGANSTSFAPGPNTPPANQVDLGELTVGSHQVPYRFSLCARGKVYDGGAASATATVTIDWE